MVIAFPVMVRSRARFVPRPRPWLPALALVLALCLGIAGVEAGVDEGFGVTPGGTGQPVFHVTSLADHGPGTLRDALGLPLAGGNRTIVFDVAGEILLADFLYVNGPFVTIDGTTAPSPGITLLNFGLVIHGDSKHGANDVIVRGLRVRNSKIDGIQIASGAARVVVDHCSVAGSGDGSIDITEDSHDVTIAWTILARPKFPQKNQLIKYNPSRITLHHNFFVASQRNPLISMGDSGEQATDTTVDMRNNVVWDWRFGSGTVIRNNAWANVVGNFYGSLSSSLHDKGEALIVCPANCFGLPGGPGRAYVADNFNYRGPDVNDRGTEAVPFPAAAVTTEDVCPAAYDVKAQVGVRPLDQFDAALLARLTLPPCKPDVVVSKLRSPAPIPVGGGATATYTLANAGAGRAAPFTIAFWFSLDSIVGPGDIFLTSIDVDGLRAGESHDQTLTFSAPPGLAPGVYRLIAVADPGHAIPDETTRANNVTSTSLRILGPDLAVFTVSAPPAVGRGTDLLVLDTIGNRGNLDAPPTVARYYLSVDRTLGASDRRLGERDVSMLVPHATDVGSTKLAIPTDVSPGDYYVIVVADALGQLVEPNEADNFKSFAVTIR